MLAAIVVLHLVVHDANTGMLLYETERAMPSYANTIDACRKTGVAKAKRPSLKPQHLSRGFHQCRLRMAARCRPRRSRVTRDE